MANEKRLIDANAFLESIEGIDWYTIRVDGSATQGAPSEAMAWYKATDIYATIENAPTVDAVEVVRCKDCKHRGDYPCPMYYEQLVEQNYGDGCIEYEWAEHDRTLDNGFCGLGERKDNG